MQFSVGYNRVSGTFFLKEDGERKFYEKKSNRAVNDFSALLSRWCYFAAGISFFTDPKCRNYPVPNAYSGFALWNPLRMAVGTFVRNFNTAFVKYDYSKRTKHL